MEKCNEIFLLVIIIFLIYYMWETPLNKKTDTYKTIDILTENKDSIKNLEQFSDNENIEVIDNIKNSQLLHNNTTDYSFTPILDFKYGTKLDDINKGESKKIGNVDTTVVNFNNDNLDKYNVADFLPKETNDEWFDTDFSQAKHNINDGKLINTDRYVIGVNTVGQSLKNASYDIRSTIPNPKISVSPWNNSTYEPDYNIKSLC